MVFNVKVFYVDDDEEAFAVAVEDKKKDERERAKDGSKKCGKKNAVKAANEPKVVTKPVEKPEQPIDGRTETEKNADRRRGDAVIDLRAPSLQNIPPVEKSASKSQPQPAPAVKEPVSRDDKIQLQPPRKVSNLLPVKGDHDNDDSNKKSVNNSTPRHQNREPGDLRSTAGKLVLKMRLHCEGCNDKVRRAIKKFEGVKTVAIDADNNLVTVTGPVTAENLIPYLEQRLKQEIIVVLLPAKPDQSSKEEAVVADWKATEGPKPKTAAGNIIVADTLNLRIELHCIGCMEKIRTTIRQFKGVDSVKFHVSDDLVTVKGKVDTSELLPYLMNRLKHNVEVVPTRNVSAPLDKTPRPRPPTPTPMPTSTPTPPPFRPSNGPEKKLNEDPQVEAGKGVPVKRVTPATPPSLQEKDVVEKVSNWSPRMTYWDTGVHADYNPGGYYDGYRPNSYSGGGGGGYHRHNYHNRIDYMFNDENPYACSIM